MKLLNYTKAEFKELQIELKAKVKVNELEVRKLILEGKLTPTKEAKLLEFLNEHKYTTDGKSLLFEDFIVIVEVAEGVEVTNKEILEVIEHNKKELASYHERKEMTKKETVYQADTEVTLPEISLGDLKVKHDTKQSQKDLATIVKNAMSYDDYEKEPCKFTGMRPNLFLNVDFQRPNVWDIPMKQRLIMSILKGLPIGTIYYNNINIYSEARLQNKTVAEMSEIDDVIFDGKQRISAIVDFKLGKFPVQINGLDYYYHNMMTAFTMAMSNTISVISTSITSKKELIEFYLEINTNKVEHDELDIKHAKEILENL